MSVGEFLAPETEDHQLPERRIRDAGSAYSIAMQLIQEDLLASQNRAQINGLIDGRPPYNQEDLDEAGQSNRVNVNTKDAVALESQAVRAYYDLTTSVESLITCETKYGDAVQRPYWCNIISDEFTRTLRRWGLFNLRTSNLHLQYVRHGVGMAFFENEVDWRFRTCGLDDFKIRRNTPASEEEVDVAMVSAPYSVTQIYGMIRNADAARENGWDVEQAYQLCLENVNIVRNGTGQTAYISWEQLERQIKENDIYYGSGDYHVWLNHLWVKEFDGTMTHIIVPREMADSPNSPNNIEDQPHSNFLYENRFQYKTVHEAFTIFTYGIGDGTYHSIRGMGFLIFDQETAYNHLWNSAMDGAQGNSITMFQPKTGSNTDYTKMALDVQGPFAILQGGYEVVNRTIPDFTKAVIPVLSELKNQIRNNTNQYSHSPTSQDAQHITARNYQAYLQQEAALSDSALDLWYAPWGRLLSEVFRRMQSRDYCPEDPGWREVEDLKIRLKQRNVPLEAFYEAHNIVPVKSVGAGSKQSRLQAYDQAIAMSPSTDEQGRYNLQRDKAILLLGSDAANRYWPIQQGPERFEQDQHNAFGENNQAIDGHSNPVLPGDQHFVHCKIHAPLIQNIMKATAQGGNTPLQTLQQASTVLGAIVPHFNQHVQLLSQDKSREAEAKQFAQLGQQAAAEKQRVDNQIQRQQQAAQEAQQAEMQRQQEAHNAEFQRLQQQEQENKQGGNDPAIAAKIQQQLIAHHVKMGIMQAQANQQLENQRAQAQQNLDIQKATLAQQLAFKDSDNALALLHQGKVNPYPNPITGQ